jgi:hypothetical protein
MVRCADKTTADKVKSQAPPALIFLDGDGKEYYRTAVSGGAGVEEAMKKALEMYANKPVSWATGDAGSLVEQSRSQKKLLALVFLDEKKDSEAFAKALEDRWIAKHHERLVFQRVEFERDSAAAKAWGVTSAPSMVLVNPEEQDDKKRVIDRLASKKEIVSIRAFLVKAFEKAGRTSAQR